MMTIHPSVNADTIRRLYVDDELSWREVAQVCGVSERTIRRWARFYGIPSCPPNVWTQRSRDKLSRAKTGKRRSPFSAEWRANLSNAHKGQEVSPEQRAKLSIALKGRTFSKETRRRMSQAQRGRTQPEERNRKRSKTMKKRWQDPVLRAKWMASRPRGKANTAYGGPPPVMASPWAIEIALPSGGRMLCRGKTEATVATAFDKAGIVFEYEQHTFALPGDTETYTPDFYLPNLDCYIEVKSGAPSCVPRKLAILRRAQPNISIHLWTGKHVRRLQRGTHTVMELLSDQHAPRRQTNLCNDLLPIGITIVRYLHDTS